MRAGSSPGAGSVRRTLIQHNPTNNQPSHAIWLLVGPKGGDNAQVRALGQRVAELAAELGSAAPGTLADATVVIREIELDYRWWELLVHCQPRGSLAAVRRGRPDLTPPWPEVVVAAGRRSEPVARWIARQSCGATRLVFVGRPWAPLDAFDLILSTPQYSLIGDNVLELSAPLVAPADARLTSERTAWQEQFSKLPAPRIGVLLGGDSGYYLFRPEAGRVLGKRLDKLALELGGSLLVTSSRRTPAGYLDALTGELTAPHFAFRWGEAGPNPYLGILAWADGLIVTAESMSMIAEALATGTPTALAPVTEPGPAWWRHADQYRWRALSHRAIQAFAPVRFRRDVTRIQDQLAASGRTVPMDGLLTGQRLEGAAETARMELDLAAARVLGLAVNSLDAASTR